MNGILNENQLAFVKDYKFDIPLIHKMDSIIDDCYRDCHNNYFHANEYCCVYSINFTNIRNNEIIILPSSDENLGLYDLKKIQTRSTKGFFI